MKGCIIPTCSNTKELTPEKIFFKVPVEERIRKRWCRHVKVKKNFSKSALVCEDHFNFEKDVENYMKVRLMNAKPVLKKDVLPNRFLGLKQKAGTRKHQELQELGTMESKAQIPLKNQVLTNLQEKLGSSCNKKEEKQLGAFNSCMLCQRVFSSQVSLAAHFSSCIMHLGYEHTSSILNTTHKSTETTVVDTTLGQQESIKYYHCNICLAKFAFKHTWKAHHAMCNAKYKQKDQNHLTSSLKKPELPIFYYCSTCFTEFDEKRTWESHLAKCEHHPKQKTKDHNSSGATFTKEPSKDVLHEKVIEDESWLVTSLPQGYECVDAMFVVEAEGTCMLQQEIPVEPEEEQFQCLEEQKEQEVYVSEQQEEQTSSLEQDFLPPWCFSLLPGALETEEEKEMMEQKLVLEPRFMQRAFVFVRGRPPEDHEEQEEEVLQDPLAPTEVPEVKEEPREVVAEDSSTITDFSMDIKHQEVHIKLENEGTGDNLEESGVNPKVVSDSPSACLEQLRIVDTQVACH